MARTRRKSSGGRGRKKNPNWLLLLVGLGIGIAAVFLAQLVMEHNLHRTVAGWFKRDKPADTHKADKKEADRPKQKFDFYTILPETETRLPDRREPRTAKTEKEKPEEDVNYVLQAGSFPTFGDADQLKARLALHGLQAQIQKISIDGKGEFHRVRLGPYEKLSDLDAADQQLARLGIKTIRLKVKKGAG